MKKSEAHLPSQRYVFFTLPGYTFMAVSSAIEVLQSANRVLGREAYAWSVASLQGDDVPAENGLSLRPTVPLAEAGPADIFFVCGGTQVDALPGAEVLAALRRAAIAHPALGGFCNGVLALAKAGLLDRHQAAIHWENKFNAEDQFPRVQFSDALFAMDRSRLSAAGGTASLHLMLNLLREQHGEACALLVSRHLGVERIRDGQDRQYVPMQARVGLHQSTLIEVSELMEANIEEPLSLDDIARLVHISRRQLERLFKRYVGEVPTKYYMDLRLNHARFLVLQTRLSMIEIATACGFVNAPYFSRCYRDKFGHSPSAERTHKPDARPTHRVAGADAAQLDASASMGAEAFRLRYTESAFHVNLFTQLNTTGLAYAQH